MKVYEIATGYTPIPARMGAATEIVAEELTRALRERNIPAEIVDMAASGRLPCDLPIREVPVPRWLDSTDVKLGLRHKCKRVVYSLCLARELKKLLAESKGECVLHFHNQYNLFFFLLLTPARLRRRCVIAYTNHSGIWRLPWEESRKILLRRHFQEAVCMKSADVVFVLNEETARNAALHLGIPRQRLVLTGNGVNGNVYRPLADTEREKIKKQYGLEGKTVILQAGSVCENKGQARILSCLAPLMHQRQDVVFAYVGGIVSQAYQMQIQQTARDLGVAGQVRYLGTAGPGEEMNRIYNLAAATVLLSRYEGFPLAVVESMAAGVPVLTAFPLGEGCIPCTTENLAERVQALLIERETLSRRARGTALSCHSWEAVAAEHTGIWQRELSTRTPEAKRPWLLLPASRRERGRQKI